MSGSKVGLSAPRRRTPQSELAKAVRMMGAAAGRDAAKGLFGQSVSVAIGATTLSPEAGYDIHFEIPFDSDTERLFSIILEEDPDVIRWIKPPLNQLGLFWQAGQQYNPDFLVIRKLHQLSYHQLKNQ